jgi:isochorismate synthase
LKERGRSHVKEFDIKEFQKVEILKAGVQSAYDLGLPMAIWRLPNTSEIHFIAANQEATKLDNVDLAELPEGFIASKFDASTEKYFIQKDIHFSFDFEEVISQFRSEEERSSFQMRLMDNLDKKIARPDFYTSPMDPQLGDVDYEQLVQVAIERIKAGVFEKVVPARAKKVSLSEDFNIIDLFLRLCEAYENAFISCFSISNEGTWLGASPEILINTQGSIFETVSLAGTRKWQEEEAISETSWNQKEIEEQAMVSRYIINCFKKIRLREFKEKGPKTIRAGNLLHLKTSFQVDMEETNFPELPTVILELLHPTSAVAGMPKKEAMAFLAAHEGLDRGFYAGYLGPVNLQNSTQLFVNLRCMQIGRQNALLYAGAGVTEDSNPEKEYLETEMKCNTLLNKIIHRI